MDKKNTKGKKKNELGEVLEIVNFIKNKVEELPTEDQVRDIVREELKPTNDRLDKVDDRVVAVESKVKGIYTLLEDKARDETILKIPRRVRDLEESEYGAGKSRHPKHVQL